MNSCKTVTLYADVKVNLPRLGCVWRRHRLHSSPIGKYHPCKISPLLENNPSCRVSIKGEIQSISLKSLGILEIMKCYLPSPITVQRETAWPSLLVQTPKTSYPKESTLPPHYLSLALRSIRHGDGQMMTLVLPLHLPPEYPLGSVAVVPLW